MKFSDPVWQVVLALLGEIAPAIALCMHRERLLSSEEFVDLADHVINALALFMLDEDAPAVGVLCMDEKATRSEDSVA